jgi:hypothetical protein
MTTDDHDMPLLPSPDGDCAELEAAILSCFGECDEDEGEQDEDG